VPPFQQSTRLWRTLLWLVIAALCAWRFTGLAADFPNQSQWMLDQAKYTDEGWWGGAAVMQHLTGHWFVGGDYNPATAVPVWPILLAALFHFTGVSILAARALNVAISIANVALVYLVVRRNVEPGQELPPLHDRLVFGFDEPRGPVDAAAFGPRFDVLHRTFLGYPASLAPPTRTARFFQLYRDIVAGHAKAEPKSRFTPDEAGWAAVCYGLVRHPEFHLY